MDEFSKPFEYEEEKRGIILLFIIMVLSIDTFLAVSFTYQVYNHFSDIPVLRIGYLIIGILFALFMLFTTVTCFKLKKNMVALAKKYLIARVAFMICSVLIIFSYSVNDKSLIGNGLLHYQNVTELTVEILIAPIAFTLVFSALWYLYFLKSKRCREIAKKS